jgi:flavorubredoxin
MQHKDHLSGMHCYLVIPNKYVLIQNKKNLCTNEYFQYLRKNSDSIIILQHDDLKTN